MRASDGVTVLIAGFLGLGVRIGLRRLRSGRELRNTGRERSTRGVRSTGSVRSAGGFRSYRGERSSGVVIVFARLLRLGSAVGGLGAVGRPLSMGGLRSSRRLGAVGRPLSMGGLGSAVGRLGSAVGGLGSGVVIVIARFGTDRWFSTEISHNGHVSWIHGHHLVVGLSVGHFGRQLSAIDRLNLDSESQKKEKRCRSHHIT